MLLANIVKGFVVYTGIIIFFKENVYFIFE